ncbi:MAG: hypothetical protein HKL99_14245 [Burkholderiales bacterium]|nr:hypothetical protein [Burkholderiales bacterium]
MEQTTELPDYVSKTRIGQLQSTIEADFDRQTRLLRISLESIVSKFPPETIDGVERALSVVFGNVDRKLEELRTRVTESERLWIALQGARQTARGTLSAEVGPAPACAMSGKKLRAWGAALQGTYGVLHDSMRQFAESVDAYMNAQADILRLRFEIAELANSAGAFVSEQALVARRLGEVAAPAAKPVTGLAVVRVPTFAMPNPAGEFSDLPAVASAR